MKRKIGRYKVTQREKKDREMNREKELNPSNKIYKKKVRQTKQIHRQRNMYFHTQRIEIEKVKPDICTSRCKERCKYQKKQFVYLHKCQKKK